ncbi:MAG TPA: NTF2-like N-terminal transpeptidase domain-containing protein, partial [Solirubrobacterales bacterium]
MKPLSPEVERRRRLLTRTLPLTLVAVLAFAWGAATGSPSSPEKEVAERFIEAWERKDFEAMYRELNAESRRSVAAPDFVAAYREAAEVATLRALPADGPDDPIERDGATIVAVQVEASTVAFGQVEAGLELPVADGGVAWHQSLVFPGLRRGEHLESRVELAPRAPILAKDGTPLAEGPAEAREHPIGGA